METITPHLWFDKEAKEAAALYTSVFPRSRIKRTAKITGTPSGDCDLVSFELLGQPFEAISAGPYFKFNPSVSFMVNFDPSKDKSARENLDRAWEKLLPGGSVLMPLQEYPFSKRYGWLQDKYGLSWQLILTNPEGEERPGIIPSLLFVGDNCGRAEEALSFYTSVFKNSRKGTLMRYDGTHPPDKEGTIAFTDFKLENMWMAAMDSAHEHGFAFNEAISFIVHCDTQREIDYFWGKMSAVAKAEACGWLKDKFGLSWQIVPSLMQEMLATKDKAKLERVTQAFLKMKKFDIKEIERAAAGGPASGKPVKAIARKKTSKSKRRVGLIKQPKKTSPTKKSSKAKTPAKKAGPKRKAKVKKSKKAKRG
ncbi:MAG: VOC family protein [Spirochaetia bacterium]|nr:VOC family protein [Spirochaetia bacterium]